MSTLYRTRLFIRHVTPMYPFTPVAVDQYGELRPELPGHGSRVKYVVGPAGVPYEYEGGPAWRTTRADGLRDAIAEAEAAAASIAAVLDGLRQELLNEPETRHAVATAADAASARIAGPVRGNAGSRG